MTIGIYCLRFVGTNKVYIGQSINIEKRYASHLNTLRNLTGVIKLQEAFNKFGAPKLEILVECGINLLNSEEIEAINIFNSVEEGFNSYNSPYQAPISKYGEDAGNAIYSNDQVLEVFNLLTSTTYYTASMISKITGVSKDVISGISCGSIHRWLQTHYPEQYQVLINKKGSRRGSISNEVSIKLGAKNQGITYPKILSPEGIIFDIDNAYRFAKERGLAGNHFQEVLNGHRKSRKGWKLWVQPDPV